MGNLGAMDEEIEQFRDIEGLSDLDFSDMVKPLPDGLDDTSFASIGNLVSLPHSVGAFGNIADMASFGGERIGDNIALTGGSSGSSASGDLALDRMVSDALIHASKSGLKLPWGDGPLASVFGESTMQIFPVVEQCISLADHPGVKSVGTRATMQSTEVVVSKRTYFDHAVSMKLAGRKR